MALMTSIREKNDNCTVDFACSVSFEHDCRRTCGRCQHRCDQLFGNVNPQTTIARINDQDISPDRFNNLVNQ